MTSQPITPQDYRQAVQDLLLETLKPAQYQLPLAQAHLHYAAEAIIAPSNIPAFANSQMDGYALTPAAANRPERTFTVGQDIPAGSTAEVPIDDDIAYPIMTGAPLPAGYACVIPEEHAQPLGERTGSFARAGSRVELPLAETGQFVRYPGEDVQAGQMILDAGTRLTAAFLGALAAQGIGSVAIKAPLRVLVLTGGDEVARSDSPLEAGKIYDANGPLIQGLLAEFGAEVTRHHLNDRSADLLTYLETHLAEEPVDLMISSGGISHGKYEVVKNAVELLHKRQGKLSIKQARFGPVAQQPGGPQGLILLEVGDRPIPWLAFPGNPVSTLVSANLTLRPALYRLYTGKDSPETWGHYVGEPAQAPAEKTQYRRARAVLKNDGRIELEADAQTGSHLLHRAAGANTLIELLPGKRYQPDDLIRYYRINEY